MNRLQTEEITLQVISYAKIPFKARIYADLLTIDWGNNTTTYQPRNNCFNIEYAFPQEGMQNIVLSGVNITHVELSGLNITNLILNNCLHLEYLNCSGNELTTLNVENCPALEELFCNSNNLTELIIPKNASLMQLNASYNDLTKLQTNNCPNLHTLYCAHNKLTSLDLSACPALNDINISHNLFTPDAINQLFHQLPLRSIQDYAIIHYPENPDFETCDITITEIKNWH